jgi:hypothetical protein
MRRLSLLLLMGDVGCACARAIRFVASLLLCEVMMWWWRGKS